MCISLRDRDLKYVVGTISNHMILKSRSSQHIFQHKSMRYYKPLIKIYANTCMHTNNHAHICIYMICTHKQDYTHTCICKAIDIYSYVHAHPQQMCMSISAYVYSSTNNAWEDKILSAYRWLSTKLLQLPPQSRTKPSIRTSQAPDISRMQ